MPLAASGGGPLMRAGLLVFSVWWGLMAPGAAQPTTEAAPDYFVVQLGLSDTPRGQVFADVARAVAAFHRGALIRWDGRDPEQLLALLRPHRPTDVLFVVEPPLLDVQLHRRILLAAGRGYGDRDFLPDFRFGYFTAADGEGLRALWARTQARHRQGPHPGKWVDCGVTSGMRSRVYAGKVPALAKRRGWSGDTIYFATKEADPATLDFVGEELGRLRDASVVEFSGNGDPQGIWLFSGRGNLDRARHWPYEAQRVGSDPAKEMPRITARHFARLGFQQAPLVWSGTCHSGAVERVWVEGDIVSTFGRVERATVHRLAPEDSLALTWISAGASALIVPIGANHGMSVLMERDFALSEGACLGEIVRRTWCDVFLAAGGAPALDFHEAGGPLHSKEPVMQGGGANRILIGDPRLRFFEATPNPTERVEVEAREDGSLAVSLRWEKGFHARGWDIFGTDRSADWRIGARVDATGLSLPKRDEDLLVTLSARSPEGGELPYRLKHARLEDFDGRRYLYLQANAPRAEVRDRAVEARFEVHLKARSAGPRDVTVATLADPRALARLQAPGKVLFEEGFEDPDALDRFFEVRGRKEGRVEVRRDRGGARLGEGFVRFVAPPNEGRAAGSGASGWLGPRGHDAVHYRRYIRHAEDYDQGDLHHTGGGLAAFSGTGKWDEMGKAGLRPDGSDRFTCGMETWRAWGRHPAPGYAVLYTYWMGMKRDPDGKWWGNLLQPRDKARRKDVPRGRWVCYEQMVRANTPGKADGELAAWIDGALYLHLVGLRLRRDEKVRVKRFDLGIYVHRSRQRNQVDYDGVVLSTGYVGPAGGR